MIFNKEKALFFYLFLMVLCLNVFAQQTIVKGSVLNATTNKPISAVIITIEETGQVETTDINGQFKFSSLLSFGEQYLKIEKEGFLIRRYLITITKGKIVDIQDMTLELDIVSPLDLYTIVLTDDELNSDDDSAISNVSGLLQSSKDAFLKAAAYDFSATFFRPRGLDNSNSKVLINSIEMNKQLTGRPQWANWGGLNDMQRNQEFSMGITPNQYSFGDLAGTNNITMRASKYRKGGRVSYASSNRSYQGRTMASYSSGLLKNNWAYSISSSRRYGEGGYIQGALYDSNSLFISLEKKINNQHSLNFLSIFAKNRRGRGTPFTDEVFKLKNSKYNPNWGELNGEIRNTNMRRVEEPILMLNHYWSISNHTTLNSNIAFQFGEIGNTRIDNGGTRLIKFEGQDAYIGGGRNTSPIYYQNLPSYHLNKNLPEPYDFQKAYVAQQNFSNKGQFDWYKLYSANANSKRDGHNSIYIVQEDRVDDKQLTINTVFNTEINDNIQLNAVINYRHLSSENFAEVKDLLGGTGYLDIDSFNDETPESGGVIASAQSNVKTPNRIAIKGDKYKYHYNIKANVISGFTQAQFKYNKLDFFLATTISQTTYQRQGFYENGYFKGSQSFGKSDKLNFYNYAIKTGLTYKISGRHLLDFNTGYLTKAPKIRDSYQNVRQNNTIVDRLENEKIKTIDASYIFRSTLVKARLTGFYTKFQDGLDIGFYYTQLNSGAFVQEIVTGIEKQNIGIEFGIEAQILPTLNLKAAVSVGQYTFTNNPNIYLASDDFENNITFGDGTTNLKNNHVPGGPERVFQLGFEYRDPEYWNFGLTTNFFSHAYADINNLKRSSRFNTDLSLVSKNEFKQGGNFTGLEFNDYDIAIAKKLLKQEQFDKYILVNLNGGKSWKLGAYFLGFFATINNVLNKQYKTGGFEQGRILDYRGTLEEKYKPNGAVFGNRYFRGFGTTYYINFYIRF